MPFDPTEYQAPLNRAHEHATEWLATVPTRPVRPSKTVDELGFDTPLPESPTDPVDVIDELVAKAEPGLMAIPSGKFFGWVMGGTLPAALAADWLVSAWDQNAGMRYATP
ncbi:MAG: aspartate aminotransferase family protein, partial [Rhodoglobus sp.]